MSSQPRMLVCVAFVAAFFVGEAVAGKDGMTRRDVASDDIEDMMVKTPDTTREQPAEKQTKGYSDDYLEEEDETESEAESRTRTKR